MSLLPPRPTVLVIESDNLVRATIAEILDIERYWVLPAWSAHEGWAHLEREQVDLIICDDMLPDMPGVDFLARLRNDPIYSGIPCIIASTVAKSHADALQYQPYLAKPFYLDDLPDMVAQVLGEARRARVS